ncbi:hypothetical protein CG419_07335 [Latilactobacillus curvatus]|uniref:Uncharacterized protein n=1 Tax=Latilactobacillus curvatus TaxID=28038 RepID=A0AAC9UQU9_LATCU|nr:hypothetical protein CG419_07335 [Latilactobacillus curvatus]
MIVLGSLLLAGCQSAPEVTVSTKPHSVRVVSGPIHYQNPNHYSLKPTANNSYVARDVTGFYMTYHKHLFIWLNDQSGALRTWEDFYQHFAQPQMLNDGTVDGHALLRPNALLIGKTPGLKIATKQFGYANMTLLTRNAVTADAIRGQYSLDEPQLIPTVIVKTLTTK